MVTWKFEVANWNAADAVKLAKASRDAQAAALGVNVSANDDIMFDAMATSISNMLNDMGVTSDFTVYITAQADVQDDGSFTLNLGFRVTPPSA